MNGELCTALQTNQIMPNYEKLDDLIKRFWEVEDCTAAKSIMTLEEQFCKNQFATTHTRDDNRRYIVTITFHDHIHL